MWTVQFENMKIQAEVEKLIKSGRISKADEEVLAAWVRQVSLHGPESVRVDKKWADHELEGDWPGYRSSSFSVRGRIIYRIEEKVVKIKIARITDVHDYRKGGKS
jgi:mRNA-degrading endonuclease YafQ of YafQ-DinJ toxin-antitoxin module